MILTLSLKRQCYMQKMGIYNRSLSNYEVLKAENITPEQGQLHQQYISMHDDCIFLVHVCLIIAVTPCMLIILGEIPACNLNNLVYTLRGHISFQWYSFGLAIGVPKQILNQLEDYTDEECLVEVLDYWLRHHPGKPTWQEVMEAKRKALATCNTNFQTA